MPKRASYAPVFAALGDETRLHLVTKLGRDGTASIAALAEDASITRQAITKHLRVLERAGLVRCQQSGRERLFTLRTQPLDVAGRYLTDVSAQWDATLLRLKAFAER